MRPCRSTDSPDISLHAKFNYDMMSDRGLNALDVLERRSRVPGLRIASSYVEFSHTWLHDQNGHEDMILEQPPRKEIE